jgi:hypothetical protein
MVALSLGPNERAVAVHRDRGAIADGPQTEAAVTTVETKVLIRVVGALLAWVRGLLRPR